MNKLPTNILEPKFIRNEVYLYWNKPNDNKISIGKFSEIVEFMKIRTRQKSRDRIALLDVLRIINRTNLVDFIEAYKPIEIINELKRISEQ